jgi:serine/threonine-protein kinase
MSEPVPTRIICPGCQAVHEVETNFCGRCGTALGASGRQTATTEQVEVVTRAESVPSGPMQTAQTEPAKIITAQVQVDPWIGRLIDGRYRVLAKLGHGGMGIVYKVEHQRMGKIAAMKVLHRELAADKEVVKRFRREAEAVSKLTHPNTVQTFDFGTTEGALYLVMEYVRGEDLGAVLRRDGPLPFKRAAPIFIQICNALGEAHELGIVHRDLKPENILVSRSKDGTDHVKVLDFGLAKINEREEAAEVTGRGAIVGTPYYMSPEQIRGEVLDHRSDIYSLGAMMYRITTGEHPFHAQTPVGVLTKHLTDEVVPPRSRRPDLAIDPRIEAIILRAMAKKREARYATIDSMREDLERAKEELHISGSARIDLGAQRTPPSGAKAVMAGAGVPGIGEPVGPTPTPVRMDRRAAEGSSTAAEPRLNRDDFEAFERSLRRRGYVRLVIVPLLLLAIAGGIFGVIRWQRQQPHDAEIEPNNDTDHATLIPLGKPVRGKIGQRLSETQSDRDYYKVKLPKRSGPQKLTVSVTAIKTMDLAVAVYDPSADKIVAEADNLGVGEPEKIPGLAVSGDTVYVAVYESKALATVTEDVTDAYELTVTAAPFGDDEEREPNDFDSDALPIGVGESKTGLLQKIDDEDRWRWDGPDGKYTISVTGLPPVVPARLRAGDSVPSAQLTQTVDLKHGEMVTVLRDDPDPKRNERVNILGTDATYTLVIK